MLTVTVRTYRPGDEPTVRKGGAVLPGSNAAASEAARRDRGRTTLAAIAAEAGVSLPTVSKVVNGRTDVAAETRSRIESLLAEYDYVVPRRTQRAGYGLTTHPLSSYGPMFDRDCVAGREWAHGVAAPGNPIGPTGRTSSCA